MIELRKYLYESILDDEDSLVDDDDQVMLNDHEFKTHYESKQTPEIQDNILLYKGTNEELETDGIPISKYFENIDTIKVPDGNIVIRDNKQVSVDNLCKNIQCKYFSGISTNGASDVNITAVAASFLSDKPIELNNVNFDFLKTNGLASQLALSVEGSLPTFNNVNIKPNNCILDLSDNGLGQVKTLLAKIIEKNMDLSYTATVSTRRGDKEIKTDLKTLAKYLNMYGTSNKSKLFKLKDNVKITSFFPNFPKEFKTIQVTGHLITISFFHPDSINIYTQATKEQYLNSNHVNQLSDGWIMEIKKW